MQIAHHPFSDNSSLNILDMKWKVNLGVVRDDSTGHTFSQGPCALVWTRQNMTKNSRDAGLPAEPLTILVFQEKPMKTSLHHMCAKNTGKSREPTGTTQ